MGLSLGSNVISTNNEYGFKANVLQELEQAQNARIQALQAASDAQASALNSSQNATICTNAMENAQTYMIAAQSFMTSANESATNAYTYAHSVDPDNIVHRDGNETVTGIKTFTSNANDIQPIKIKNSKMDSSLSTIPSETTYSRYLFTDINNKDIGNYSLLQDANGNISTYMQAINYQSGSRDAATISLYNRADGTKYATCPPPPNAADNSTKIPTTQWVNNRIIDIMNSRMWLATPNFSSQVTIATEGAKITNYTAPSNGVCYGNIDGSANGNVTVNGNLAAKGGNDSGNEGPFYFQVVEGDVISSTVITRGAYFAPYKYVNVSL